MSEVPTPIVQLEDAISSLKSATDRVRDRDTAAAIRSVERSLRRRAAELRMDWLLAEILEFPEDCPAIDRGA